MPDILQFIKGTCEYVRDRAEWAEAAGCRSTAKIIRNDPFPVRFLHGQKEGVNTVGCLVDDTVYRDGFE